MTEPTSMQRAMLWRLQTQPLYMGTVSPEEIARRRAKNKQSRKSRKLNRKKS